jgi:hypothetical protein
MFNVSRYTVETTRARIHTAASSPEAAARFTYAKKKPPKLTPRPSIQSNFMETWHRCDKAPNRAKPSASPTATPTPERPNHAKR